MMTPEIADRLKLFDQDLIAFPPFVAAKDAVEENLRLFRETGVARHMLLFGESGTGKTSLCEWIAATHPVIRHEERDQISVLIVRVPPAVSLGGIAEAFLGALGSFWSQRSNVTAKTTQITHLCRQCGVELILLDEAQHLKDRGDAKSQYLIADWIKYLLDELAVPTVMLGLPRLEELLQTNEQLRRRFSRRISLALGQSDTESIETECLQLFMSLATLLNLPVRNDPFNIVDFGNRLRHATDGRVAYLKKLLFAALRKALLQDLQVIDVALLEQAFTEEIWRGGVGKLNPFNADFDFRPLDRGGEPFERAHTGGRRGRR